MGWVWNILLSHSNEELWEDGEDKPRSICGPLERINQALAPGKLVSLIAPTHKGDAGYGMDANLFGGGYKHFDIEHFIKIVEAQNWKERAGVQLWIKGGEEGLNDSSFTLIKLRSLKRPKVAALAPGRIPKHRTKDLRSRHKGTQPKAAQKAARSSR